jgi:hypothetical protein
MVCPNAAAVVCKDFGSGEAIRIREESKIQGLISTMCAVEDVNIK